VLLILENPITWPETQEQIEDELVQMLGWTKAQIYGVGSWVSVALRELHKEELLGSRGYIIESHTIEFWKVIPEPSWNW
jgi:hypothetical protein